MPTSTYITLVVIYTVQGIIIIVGNAFTIFVFWTQRSRLTRIYFLLVNLAVADFLVGITELIVIGTVKFQDIGEGYAGGVLRQSRSNLSAAFFMLFANSSVYFLALGSLERAFAVLRPIRHRITNSRIYIYSIIIVWVVGLVFFGFTALSLHLSEVKGKYVFVVSWMCLLISILITCTSYLSILYSIACKIIGHLRQSEAGIKGANLRLARTLYITIASSLVFWMPGFVVYSTRGFCPSCFCAPQFFWLVDAMFLANSMMNPLVYSFRMQIFKDALNKFRRKRRQNVRPIGQNSLGFGLAGLFTQHFRRQ